MDISILKDIVAYTSPLGLESVKIVGPSSATAISAIADDRSLIMLATTKSPVDDFAGTTCGLPNLGKLKGILEIPEYKTGAKLSVNKNASGDPENIVFGNAADDFSNTYRLMGTALVNSLISNVTFKTPKWDITFIPSDDQILKFRYQSNVLSDGLHFTTSTKNGNLYVDMGDASSHQGSFVFGSDITGTLRNKLHWPLKQVQSILRLTGEKNISISDAGALQVVVDSGIAVYNYIVPTQKK